MAASILGKFCRFCNALHYNKKVISLNSGAFSTRTTTARSSPKLSEDGWKGVIGLEIHAQIKSASKLFSGSSTLYGTSTNSNVAFLDAALPGTLPVLNRRCVKAGVETALALRCHINTVSMFDRKHYFYADLPAGYQITQFRKPLAQNGQVVYVYQCSQTSRVERRNARIVQIQLEQDSGKSLHDLEQGLSLIDLNRAGIGLMEIVTAPDFSSGDDAASFVRDLRDILLTVGSCDGKMAEGSLRVDANVSVHKPGDPLGIRTEVKNLNSFKAVRLAIEYEIERHIKILESGGVIENETRSFDDDSGETIPMRDKEKLKDYRFMPEPNLPPLVLDLTDSGCQPSPNNLNIAELKSQMKELPDEIRQRMEQEYDLSLLHSLQLVRSNLQDLFEVLVNNYSCSPSAALFVLKNSYLAQAEGSGNSVSVISETALSEIIHLYASGRISGNSISQIFEELIRSPDLSPHEIVESKNLWNVEDNLIVAAIDDVIERNPKIVKAYKKGKKNQLKVLTLKVLNRLGGKAPTGIISQQLASRLKE